MTLPVSEYLPSKIKAHNTRNIMKSSLILVLMAIALQAKSQSQTIHIKGKVVDTLNETSLKMASVSLLRASDSILVKFGRSDAQGMFDLTLREPGKYIALVTFPSFADYVDVLDVPAKPEMDLGVIPMVTKSHLLSEFVLKQQLGAIKIKGDTTEYVADSFNVRDNATVADLLKKLPGIQINKNGEVVAQGETVKKILVDGEEFFTDDPAVVTKSLQAKAIDKVQVYDSKSDQAAFTGIDDGVREKTINLQLKDEYKRGYFGKVTLGGGTEGFHQNEAMLNLFKGKRKLSVFGIAANTGKVGLNWQDRDKFGGGNDMEYSEDGFMYSFSSGEDDESWNGTYNGQGLPAAWTGGLHYSNKWLADKLRVSSNYRGAKQNLETVGGTLTQYNLAGQQYYTDERNTSFNTSERHRGDGLMEWKPDTTSNLKLTANAGTTHSKTTKGATTISRDTSGNIFNENYNNNFTDATTNSLNTQLSYRKRFAKKGRTIALTTDQSYRATNSESQFLSTTIIRAGNTSIPTNFDQKKQNESSKFQLNGNLTYTEPISKVMFVELTYGLTVNNSNAKRLSFNKDNTDGSYRDLDSTFSSDYDFDVTTHKGGGALRFVFKKVTISGGGSIAATRFRQDDKLFTRDFDRRFTNFFPRANIKWKMSQQRSLSVNYNGSTQQPTIDQIQPLQQNTDPLNITVGNAALRQEFEHSINANFNDYKVLSGTYIYSGVTANFVQDAISNAQTIDAARVRKYQYINVDGNYNGYLYGGMGKQIRKLEMRVGFNTNINVSRNNTIVNGAKNRSDNNSFTLGLNISKEKEDAFEISYNPSVTFNNNTSSVNNTTTNFFTYNQEIQIVVELPHHFEVGTDVDWNIRQRVAAFDRNNNVFKWNAYVSKKFLKNEQLELRAYMNDMLNQNLGFSRFGTGNTVTEQNYNTIRRYGMLSLVWNFTKAPAAPTDAGNNIINIK